MWAQRGPEQLAKCAVALAFRAAFPNDLSGLFTNDEMGQADRPAPPVRAAVTQPSPTKTPELPADGRLRGIGKGPLAGKVLEEATMTELGSYIADMERAKPRWPSTKLEQLQTHFDAACALFDARGVREMDKAKAQQPLPAAGTDPIADGIQREYDRTHGREPGVDGDDDHGSYLEGDAA
jgi:hypothetical protein